MYILYTVFVALYYLKMKIDVVLKKKDVYNLAVLQ